MSEESKIFELLTWRDIKAAITDMDLNEIRFLVDNYYNMQDQRKRQDNQTRSLRKTEEPCEFISWSSNQFRNIEEATRKALGYYLRLKGTPVDHWALSITGIGPVITAGLKAHIDITKAPTAGHIWSYAGLSSNIKWEKGQKRPWNASLKTLCFLIGESFIKFQNAKGGEFYGKFYRDRKDRDIELNEQLAFAEQAAEKLTKLKSKTTDAYKAYSIGKLPPAHIHARARRHAVKIFLSHYHQVAYEYHYGEPVCKPWVIEHGGHSHMIDPPNYEPLRGNQTLTIAQLREELAATKAALAAAGTR